MRTFIALAAIILFGWPAPPAAQAQPTPTALTPAAARAIAKDAYIYGFPLVENYRVMHPFFMARKGKEFKVPWNQIHNAARVFTPANRTIQRPNSDTSYSQLGADLQAEPLVIIVPAIPRERPTDPGRSGRPIPIGSGYYPGIDL